MIYTDYIFQLISFSNLIENKNILYEFIKIIKKKNIITIYVKK